MLIDLYAALGLDPSAPSDAIAPAYRAAALRAHPDSGGSHEQFLVVDLAWRLLRDPDTRRRFDAQWQLHLAIGAGPTITVEQADRLIRDAERALSGWRLPVELRAGVLDLTARSQRWRSEVERARRNASGAGSGSGRSASGSGRSTSGAGRSGSQHGSTGRQQQQRANSRQRDGERRSADDGAQWTDEQRRRMNEGIALFVDQAIAQMERWSSLLDMVCHGSTLRIRRSALAGAHGIYTVLRSLQDAIEWRHRYGVLDDENVRVFVHTSETLLTLRAVLADVQVPLGKKYSLKSEAALQAGRDRARAELRRRGLDEGSSPWGDVATVHDVTDPHVDDVTDEPADADTTTSGDDDVADEPVTDPAAGVDDLADNGTTPGPPSSPPPVRTVGPPSRARAARTAVLIAMIATPMWFARETVIEVVTAILAMGLLIGLVFVLAVSAEARRVVAVVLGLCLTLVFHTVRVSALLLVAILGLFVRRR